MMNPGFKHLGAIFEDQARYTWQRLSYVNDSYNSRGLMGPVRFGEETITDLMMMDLYTQGSTVAMFEQTTKRKESVSGTDFELWLGTEQLGWFRFAIQAKKLNVRTGRFASLSQSNSHGEQIKLLENFSDHNRAASLYCLYGYDDKATEHEHWRCCTGVPDVGELGCVVTPSAVIRDAIKTRGGKDFKSIYGNGSTLPWRCLASCPIMLNSLDALSKGNVPGRLALFNPADCYHQRLPRVFLPESGRVVSENARGGSLITIPRDMYEDTPGYESEVPASIREDFSERYHRENGIPGAAGVMRL